MSNTDAHCWDKIRLPGDIPLLLQRIPKSPPGGFLMGSRGKEPDEEPAHRVSIPDDFYLGTVVVTQEQYAAVAQKAPALQEWCGASGFEGNDRPVENVDWREANHFCAWLTDHTPASQLPPGFELFCLPTEAEWEYACRAGTDTDYYSGDGEAALSEVGWFNENSRGETHPVEAYPIGDKPEAHLWGLRGTHGNVLEWCHDVYDSGAYRERVDGDPDPGREQRRKDLAAGIENLTRGDDLRFRVVRGGSWDFTARGCRSAYRLRWRPVARDWNQGFRVCLVRGPSGPSGARKQENPAEARRGPGVGVRRQRTETNGPGRAGAKPSKVAADQPPGAAGRKNLSKSASVKPRSGPKSSSR